MPLRVVSRPGTATLYVRGTVRKQSVFESTGTADPNRAEGYRAKREAELWDRSVYGTRATVTFAEAVASYLQAEPRRPYTKTQVGRLLDHFATQPLKHVTQEAVDRAYLVLLSPGVSNATKLRHVLTPLRAILEHAARRGWCNRPAFETPKQPKAKTPYLLPAQATAVVQNAAPHLRPLIVFLVGTGARMSEALELDWPDVDLFGATATLRQKQGTERKADLPPVVLAALSTICNPEQRNGRVFRPPRGTAYRDTQRTGGGQIKNGWASACHRAGLPGTMQEWPRTDRPKSPWRRFHPDVTPHACRHTWASWHYCLHHDLIRLRDDGGWETVSMVERYAKRVPAAYIPEIKAWLAGGAELAASEVA